jgi:hypothetical protein
LTIAPESVAKPYGGVICDLECRRIVDLLPDREPGPVEVGVRYGSNADRQFFYSVRYKK